MLFTLQTSLFYQLFIFTTLVWFALWVYRRREFRKLASQIPDNRFRYYPLVGHAYKFFGDGEDRMEVFKMVAMDAINAGGVIKFWMGTRLFLVIADPVLAETIAKTCLQKDELMELIQELTGDGLIFAKASIWRPRRRVLAPVFRRRHLAPFVKVFAQESRLLASRLSDRCQRGDFSLWNYLTTYTMDSVCATDLGVNVGAQNSPFHPFLVNFETFARGVSTRIVNVWMHSSLVYWFSPLYRDMRDAVLFLHEFVDKIIAKKRKELEEEKNKNEVSNGEMKNAPNDKELPFRTFLELIMSTQEGSQYSDKVLREETLVIALAGTDTSAVGACFTLCLLARYPEVQERVYEELREVFEDSDRPITNEDYPRLRYLEAVCKESLRLYPPVPVIAREAESYVTLPTGVTVVPGTSIVLNIWGVHRNPQYWGADAEQFRPERFLEPLKYPNAYMPFSCGPRNCLGLQYAMMSLKAGVAAVVRRYRALPPAAARPPPRYREPHGFRLKLDIMMKDVDDFQLRLERRVH